MGDAGPHELPAQVRNHIETVTARGGCDFQIDCKDNEENDRHAERGDRAHEHGQGHQNLVKALADVGGQRAEQVAQQPADENRGQLQRNGPGNGAGDDVGNGARILAEGGAEIAADCVFHEDKELLVHRLVGAEFLLIALVDFLHGAGVGHALGQLAGDGGHRVGRHQPRQNEVQNHGNDKRDYKPQNLLAEIFAVSLHVINSPIRM